MAKEQQNKKLSDEILLEALKKQYFELAAKENIADNKKPLTPELTVKIDKIEQLITDMILDKK